MALSRVTVWTANQILTAAALNGEFNNILNNALSLISPLTGTLNVNSQQLTNVGTLTMGTNFAIIPAAVSGTPTQHALYQGNVMKGWVNASTAGAINASHNVTSVTDTGAGQITVTWDRDFASDKYVVGGLPCNAGTTTATILVAQDVPTSKTAGACLVEYRRVSDAALTDPSGQFTVMAIGNQ